MEDLVLLDLSCFVRVSLGSETLVVSSVTKCWSLCLMSSSSPLLVLKC